MSAAAERGRARALTHGRILRIALPIVVSNATVPLLGIVDTAVVGRLGAAAPIAAVGVGASLLTAVYWLFGFLRMGTTGLAAQARGAGDRAEEVALLSRALLIAGAAGSALIVLQAPLIALALLVTPDLPEVERLAADYMAVRIWSAPAMIAVYGMTGWLIAAERTGAVLALQVGMNGLNMALSVWFALELGGGVAGVAWATFAAEWAGAAGGLWLCRSAFVTAAWRDRARVLDPARLGRMASVNGDILIRSAILLVAFRSFLLTGGRFGTVELAATHVLLQFLELTAYALDGFAFAAEALVGRHAGAGDRAGLRRAVRMTALWGAGLSAALALAFLIGGGAVVDLLTTEPQVRATARDYLPWMVAAPIVGLASWMLDGVFIGATRTADMRNMMAVSAAAYAAALAILVPPFGLHGLWAALLVFFAARGLTLAARYPALERSVAARVTPPPS